MMNGRPTVRKKVKMVKDNDWGGLNCTGKKLLCQCGHLKA